MKKKVVLKFKPELVYPGDATYCVECADHIRENDLFGRWKNFDGLVCVRCFDPVIQEFTEKKRESNRRIYGDGVPNYFR